MPNSRPQTPRPFPQQARAIETRARLIEAGRRAFAEYGHDGVNVERDILGPANVQFGSFYHQFNDKTDLLLAVMGAAAVDRTELVMVKGFLHPDVSDLEERLRLGVGRLFESFDTEEHAWRVQLQVRESPNPRIRESVIRTREDWIGRLAGMLTAEGHAGGTAAREAAEILVALKVGTAAMYLALDAEERSRRRCEIVESVSRFVIGGVEALIELTPAT
ncbi:MAG: helix-turn-helix domain-containing protein [Acidimicrobiales bacterium]